MCFLNLMNPRVAYYYIYQLRRSSELLKQTLKRNCSKYVEIKGSDLNMTCSPVNCCQIYQPNSRINID